MRGRQLSYHRRRRLVALISLAFVAGGVAAAIMLLPGGQKLDRGPTSLPSRAAQAAAQRATRQTHLSASDRERLRATISLFVSSSVARHHPERSWPIVHPNLREGLTKRQWSTGNIPVVPYPAVSVDLLRLESMSGQTALVEVLLEPARNSHLVRKTFQIELRRRPSLPHRWVVSSWVPEGVSESQISLDAQSHPASPKIIAEANHPAHLSTMWIILPVGIFVGGLILLPAFLLVRDAAAGRRANRMALASARNRDPVSR